MLGAVQAVLKGKKHFSAEVTMNLMSETKSMPNVQQDYGLTDRELEILKRIAEGYSNKEIGDQLHISHRTVDTHRTNLTRKLGVSNIAGLIRFAMREGLVD